MWGATPDRVVVVLYSLFQFTHPVWGATLAVLRQFLRLEVSIHAPRVGCDTACNPKQEPTQQFQFTHPVWGATPTRFSAPLCLVRFNSRTPCGVRLCRLRLVACLSHRFNSRTPCGVRHRLWSGCRLYGVSIHAPRVGCDIRHCTLWLSSHVSIHAPRVGCDSVTSL